MDSLLPPALFNSPNVVPRTTWGPYLVFKDFKHTTSPGRYRQPPGQGSASLLSSLSSLFSLPSSLSSLFPLLASLFSLLLLLLPPSLSSSLPPSLPSPLPLSQVMDRTGPGPPGDAGEGGRDAAHAGILCIHFGHLHKMKLFELHQDESRL